MSSILGGTVRSQLYALDGVPLNDPATNYSMANINVDVYEEIEFEVSGHPAEVGQTDSTYVNIVTKSGGNRFSGGIVGYYTSQGPGRGPDLQGTDHRPGRQPAREIHRLQGPVPQLRRPDHQGQDLVLRQRPPPDLRAGQPPDAREPDGRPGHPRAEHYDMDHQEWMGFGKLTFQITPEHQVLRHAPLQPHVRARLQQQLRRSTPTSRTPGSGTTRIPTRRPTSSTGSSTRTPSSTSGGPMSGASSPSTRATKASTPTTTTNRRSTGARPGTTTSTSGRRSWPRSRRPGSRTTCSGPATSSRPASSSSSPSTTGTGTGLTPTYSYWANYATGNPYYYSTDEPPGPPAHPDLPGRARPVGRPGPHPPLLGLRPGQRPGRPPDLERRAAARLLLPVRAAAVPARAPLRLRPGAPQSDLRRHPEHPARGPHRPDGGRSPSRHRPPGTPWP